MCGIAGFHELTEGTFYCLEEKNNVVNMLELQKHRGSDDRGIVGYSFEEGKGVEVQKGDIDCCRLNGLVGFNRLSIRDLSKKGHQPMVSQNGKVIIAFNGEIYNADELRDKLQKKGYRFRGMSDTEVVLNMYLEYGLDKTVRLLNGMFAIVLIDLNDNHIYLIRDRFGIKPLYYFVQNRRIYYASEYKSFLTIKDFKAELDIEALYEYMIFITSIERTLLRGVRQVNPGEIVIISEGDFKYRRFFNIDDYVRSDYCGDFSKKREELEYAIKNAVYAQMVSDVDLGCQLSGGVDSSLIAYYASGNENNMLRDSMSIVFEDTSVNEEKWIMQVASEIGIQPHKYLMNENYLITNLEKAIWHLESILTVPNAIALLLLTKNAKKEVTVLLSGEGADELFAGYSNHNSVFLRYLCTHNEKIESLFINKRWLKKKIFGDYYEDEINAAVMEMCYVKPENVARMLNISYDSAILENRRNIIDSYHGTILEKYIKYEMRTYLPELLLRQDKMSMANSIENRVPFLDNNVASMAFQIPLEYLLCMNDKVNAVTDLSNPLEWVTGKKVLKEICAEKFGYSFAYRGKCGFGLPLKHLMGMKRFKEEIYNKVNKKIAYRGLLNAEYVKWLYDRLPVLDWQEIELLWRAINVELFLQLYIDGEGIKMFN